MRYIDLLSGLRGFLALQILAYHFFGSSLNFSGTQFTTGYIAVDIFFVISGYVIAKVYLDSLISKRQFWNFCVNRFARLYPTHFLMLSIFFCLELVKYFAEHFYGVVANSGSALEKNNFSALLANILLIHGWIGQPLSSTFNIPSWSVSVEFFCYIIFALLVNYFRKFLMLTVIAIVLISLCCIFVSGSSELVRGALGFSVGVILFLVQRQKFVSIIAHKICVALSLFALIVLVCMNDSPEHSMLAIFACSPLVAFLGVKDLRLDTGLKYRVGIAIQYLGSRSYTVYMLHFFVLWALGRLNQFLLSSADIMAFISKNLYMSTFISALIFVGASIFVSELIYRKFEMPLKQKIKTLFGK